MYSTWTRDERCGLLWWWGWLAVCRSSLHSSWWWCPTSLACTRWSEWRLSAPCSAGGLQSAHSPPRCSCSDAEEGEVEREREGGMQRQRDLWERRMAQKLLMADRKLNEQAYTMSFRPWNCSLTSDIFWLLICLNKTQFGQRNIWATSHTYYILDWQFKVCKWPNMVSSGALVVQPCPLDTRDV